MNIHMKRQYYQELGSTWQSQRQDTFVFPQDREAGVATGIVEEGVDVNADE